MPEYSRPGSGANGATVATQTGTAYTLVLADANTVIDFTNAAAVTVTVPPSASVAWATGTIINICCEGAGGLTVAAGAGVTIQNNSAALVLWQEVSLRYDGSNVWIRVG